jgi:hypothetical protein
LKLKRLEVVKIEKNKEHQNLQKFQNCKNDKIVQLRSRTLRS